MFQKRYKKPKKNFEDSPEKAKETAVALLAYKENTEKELYDKLTARGFSKENAAAALAYVVEKHFLSEKRYFLRLVEYCGNVKRFGRRRIMAEIYQKGFSAATVEEYSEEAFGKIDFDENCYEALTLLKKSDREKARAALLRRGYSGDNVRYAFARFEKETGRPYGEGGDEDGYENDAVGDFDNDAPGGFFDD